MYVARELGVLAGRFVADIVRDAKAALRRGAGWHDTMGPE